MIKTDEDALICDLAEIYNIYDYKQLPLSKVAVFSYGLRNDSRIRMKMNNEQLVPLDTLLLAGISDKVNTLLWFQTKDGQKGKNRPTPITDSLVNGGNAKEDNRDIIAFDSGEDFTKARQRLIESGGE